MRKETKRHVANDKKEYKIPIEGSLGVLAIGDKGLRAWRKVIDKHATEKRS